MRIRKGDLVKLNKHRAGPYLSTRKWYMVDAGNGQFPAASGIIAILDPGYAGHIVDIKDVVDVFSRDGVKEYWKYI